MSETEINVLYGFGTHEKDGPFCVACAREKRGLVPLSNDAGNSTLWICTCCQKAIAMPVQRRRGATPVYMD